MDKLQAGITFDGNEYTITTADGELARRLLTEIFFETKVPTTSDIIASAPKSAKSETQKKSPTLKAE